MKKFFALLSFVAIGSLAVFFLFFNNIVSANSLSQMTIYYGDEPLIIMDASNDPKMTEYIDIFNLGHKIETPSNFNPEYSITISYESKDPVHLELDFDLNEAYLTLKDKDRNTYYEITDGQVETLFIDQNFKAIYPASQTPIAELSQDTVILPQDTCDTTWDYRLINGEWANLVFGSMTTSGQVFAITDISKPLVLNYDIPPTSSNLTVLKDGEIVYESSIEDLSFLPYADEGDFTYTIDSKWDHSDYKGSQSLSYEVSVDLPVRFRLSKTTATAGDFITVFADYVNEDEDLFIDQNLVKWTPSFFDNEGTKMAFIPLNYWAKTGNYSIKLSSSHMQNQALKEAEFDIRIKPKDFKKQYLYIDETIKNATRNDDAYAQYAKYFNPSRETITAEKLWDGPFIAPTGGRVSTEFGEMRYVNDSLTSYRHSGIDYAVPLGTPIKAPNRGHVNLSMFLTLTGNTIVIDHGMGLFSVYFHLDTLNVEQGQMVNKEDIIGTVGTTGFSTGPHLHYTTSIGKTNFDPNLIEGVDPSEPF